MNKSHLNYFKVFTINHEVEKSAIEADDLWWQYFWKADFSDNFKKKRQKREARQNLKKEIK